MAALIIYVDNADDNNSTIALKQHASTKSKPLPATVKGALPLSAKQALNNLVTPRRALQIINAERTAMTPLSLCKPSHSNRKKLPRIDTKKNKSLLKTYMATEPSAIIKSHHHKLAAHPFNEPDTMLMPGLDLGKLSKEQPSRLNGLSADYIRSIEESGHQTLGLLPMSMPTTLLQLIHSDADDYFEEQFTEVTSCSTQDMNLSLHVDDLY